MQANVVKGSLLLDRRSAKIQILVLFTVWNEITFQHLNGYYWANMPDIHKKSHEVQMKGTLVEV